MSDNEDTRVANARRVNQERVLDELRAIRSDPDRDARLHEIELQILEDILSAPEHFKCPGCMRWARALVEKANTNKDIKKKTNSD